MKVGKNSGSTAKRPEPDRPEQRRAPPAAPASRRSGPNELARAA
jgi:hypothetical protein